jgi:hypothetical protein
VLSLVELCSTKIKMVWFVLPGHRLFVDLVELVEALFADELFQTMGRNSGANSIKQIKQHFYTYEALARIVA